MKQELSYIKYSPTQNMTILVCTPVPVSEQPQEAARLMRLDPDTEQVGFLGPAQEAGADGALRMAAGEFCGNASMAAAAYFAELAGLRPGDPAMELSLEVSGADRLISCQAQREQTGWRCTVDMPLPQFITCMQMTLDEVTHTLPVVSFGGIWHVIVPRQSAGGDARQFADRAVRAWCQALGVPALGVLLFDRTAMQMEPIVHVPGVNTTIWERGCGSGSAALGAYLAWESGHNIDVPIGQPGGIIRVHAQYEQGAVTGLSITGRVEIVCRCDGNSCSCS